MPPDQITYQVVNSSSASVDPDIRERLFPLRRDLGYLHFVDLLHALRSVDTSGVATVLDLGCGSSPYRSLFAGVDYRRADLDGAPDIDYPLSSAETIPSDFFDLVLSTQVLEHVRDPESYLRLALRVLKPGGRLVLTTHGMFGEHACPEDYYRWTALGLEHLVELCGFEGVRSRKVTTQQRAAVFLMLCHFGLLGLKRKTLIGFAAAVLNWFRRFAAPILHGWLDRHAGECRMVDSCVEGNTLYIVLMIEAVKPNRC